jgi:argininosuccinate lyase
MKDEDILSETEIDKLLAFGWDHPNMVKLMVDGFNVITKHLRAGGKLTQKQEDTYYWIEEKLNKWKD